MEKKAKISVIIPVYNTERYLERCIKSVQRQAYINLEIILVDDGSTDNSLLICKEFEKKDGRIKVFTKPNGGVSSARNLGLEKCTGAYITFIDSDDYLPDDKYIYSKVLDTLCNNNADIAVWLWQFQDDKGNFTVKKENILTSFKGN